MEQKAANPVPSLCQYWRCADNTQTQPRIRGVGTDLLLTFPLRHLPFLSHSPGFSYKRGREESGREMRDSVFLITTLPGKACVWDIRKCHV